MNLLAMAVEQHKDMNLGAWLSPEAQAELIRINDSPVLGRRARRKRVAALVAINKSLQLLDEAEWKKI